MSPRIVNEGLQGERTALAWERTALAIAVNAGLLVRAGTQGVPWARLAGFVVLAVAGVGFVVARTRYVRRDAALRGASAPPGHPLLLTVGVLAVALSLTALGVVVVLTAI